MDRPEILIANAGFRGMKLTHACPRTVWPSLLLACPHRP